MAKRNLRVTCKSINLPIYLIQKKSGEIAFKRYFCYFFCIRLILRFRTVILKYVRINIEDLLLWKIGHYLILELLISYLILRITFSANV